jgi:hypothetical protein
MGAMEARLRRRRRRAEKRAEARRKLRSNLVRGGAAHQASARAVPYLTRLARAEEIPERLELLDIVRTIAEAPKPEDAQVWWEQHVGLLQKERATFTAMVGDLALTDVARKILATPHFAR